jgi:diaminopimelate epimerase
MNITPFIKMHGLGNDFVILDAREAALALDAASARAIANRRTGIGCDQVIVMEKADDGLADVFMRIFNADGGEIAACGNAARCVASLLFADSGSEHVVIGTESGLRDAEKAPDNQISVDMGRALFDWRDIPLAEATDSNHPGISEGPLADGCAVGMGNPHLVFFVDDAESVALETLGPKLERHSLFPERTNVEIVEVLSPEKLRLRVWERGVGITSACGTGACAALVAAHRRGLAERRAEMMLDGGTLVVEWLTDDHMLLTGPVATSFTGELGSEFDQSLLKS